MPKVITREEYIKRFINVHCNKYDYTKSKISNRDTKILIICPIHGIFRQTPKVHLISGCPKCNNDKQKLKKDEFVKRSNKIHKNKYDYSLVEYINSYTEVKIICVLHGKFKQTPSNHLFKHGCVKCSKEKLSNKYKKTKNDFIKKSKEKHKNKYNYSLVEYINCNTKVKIVCPIHGIFEQSPSNHYKYGCKECGRINIRKKRIEQIEKDKFDGNQIIPSYNKDGCRLFDKISEDKDTHIQHAMNGGEYYIKELGYWVDGYDKENNTVYEYDEPYHKYQKERDDIRQKEIENYLSCKFIRINKNDI